MEDAISFNNYYTRHLPKTYYTTKCGVTGASSREVRQTSFGQAHHSIGADGHMSPVQAPFTAPNSRLRGSYEASCGTHLLKDSSANIPSCEHWPARGSGSELGFQSLVLPKDKRQLRGRSRRHACPRPARTRLGWHSAAGRFLVKPRRKRLCASVPSSPGAGERLEVKVSGSGCPAPFLNATPWIPTFCQAGRREVCFKSQPMSLEFLKECVGVKQAFKLKIMFSSRTRGCARPV